MDKKNADGNSSRMTLSDNIYFYLKDKIIRHIIKPYEKIKENEIAAVFNSSKTPVREAIMKLSVVGFVENASDKYAVVTPCSYEKFVELNAMMSLLEGYIYKLAFKKIDEDTIRRIEEKTEEMERVCSADKINEYVDLNCQIHDEIYAAARHETCFSLIRLVRENHLRHTLFIFESNRSLIGAYLKKSIKNHKKLIQALKDRNSSLIGTIIKDHYSHYERS